jgi:uncharacterized protein CbrC (UPF0167 family)
MHTWVFKCHLDVTGKPPEIFISDRHRSLIASASQTMPLTYHIYCLHHMNDNISANLRLAVGQEWENFNHDFWATYRAVSPEEFDRLWDGLISRYPAARGYMQEELYPCCERWAWAWLSNLFTAGIRTNGCVEVENRMNKALGGPKKTLLQVFDGLNNRTEMQSVQDQQRVRCHTSFLVPRCAGS